MCSWLDAGNDGWASAGGLRIRVYWWSNNVLDVTTTSGSFTLSTGAGSINGSGAKNQGWWSASLGNSDGNDNFFTGTFDAGVTNLNNYFTFNISGLAAQTITGLTLNIQNPGSNDTSAVYSVYDVSTGAVALNNKSFSPNGSIFTDLGTGNLYGSQLIPLANASQYFIVLNGIAVFDLQTAVDSRATYFSTGGTISAAAVPEPSTFALLGIGALGMAFAHRRRILRNSTIAS